MRARRPSPSASRSGKKPDAAVAGRYTGSQSAATAPADPRYDAKVQVLQQVAGGNRNKDIAGLLFISEETVKVHIKHIMDKLGAKDRTQAIAIAVRRGIIHL